MRKQPHLQRLIPITGLRHLYQLLRDFRKGKFQLEVARELCRQPKQLANLITKSRKHLELYNNQGEGFHDRGNDGRLTADRLDSNNLADKFLRQLAAKSVSIVSAPQHYEFVYVDYDISPYRTTGSQFEDGSSGKSSGTGGMDILLSNKQDQTPIVGETKADTDVNPFLGLIQSLMYAVELSTPSQRIRLSQSYQGRFAVSSPDEGIDIYLFLLRYAQDEQSQEFLSLTNQLSAKLLEIKNMSKIVRQIVALESPMVDDILNGLTVTFAHGDKTAV